MYLYTLEVNLVAWQSNWRTYMTTDYDSLVGFAKLFGWDENTIFESIRDNHDETPMQVKEYDGGDL